MLILIEKFIEGLRRFRCTSCKHIVSIAKNKPVKCIYCGETNQEE